MGSSVIHPNPVFDQTYHVQLTCFYHNLPINCGHLQLQARPQVFNIQMCPRNTFYLMQVSLQCKAHSSFCDDTEMVVFKLPQRMTASYLGNGSVLVEWVNTDLGWV